MAKYGMRDSRLVPFSGTALGGCKLHSLSFRIEKESDPMIRFFAVLSMILGVAGGVMCVTSLYQGVFGSLDYVKAWAGFLGGLAVAMALGGGAVGIWIKWAQVDYF